jgi:VIT1/CCC1 family predicted Fe2+/Mn2+ transporter
LEEEQKELHSDPDRAKAELQEILEADGIDPDTAKRATADVIRHPAKAMAMYARGKLGINPDELGSAWGSAISSFVMFAFGAAIPLVPWLVGEGSPAVIASLTLSVLAALCIGGYLGSMTSGQLLRPALRQLFVLVLAAGLTYGVGLLFHTTVI